MVQSYQGVQSTKEKIDTHQPTTKEMDDLPPPKKKMKFMSGMNLLARFTLMIVAASRFVHAAERNIS